MFAAVWKYKVKPGKVIEFEQLYNQEGEWAQWFRLSRDYISTELMKSPDAENEYLTIDRWQSKAAYDRHYTEGRSRYEEIDLKGDGFTTEEELIGYYESV